MGQPETLPVLVPPPSGPPGGHVAAATPDPSRDPRETANRSFLQAVVIELKRVIWPASGGVWAATGVTIGLLLLFTLLVLGLNAVAGAFFSLIGTR